MSHIHGAEERYRYPIKKVPVKDFYHTGFLKGADQEVIRKYKRQITEDKYEPVFVCGDFLIDGTHRVIAAYQLGVKYIKAYVCTRRTNMPLYKVGERPSVGDFVLAWNDIWIIKSISVKGVATIENYASGEIEKVLVLNMEKTEIQTWEAE